MGEITAKTVPGMPKSSQIQVIYDKKVCTPQSLLPRKEMQVKQFKKAKHDFTAVPTIDESTPVDQSDSKLSKLMKTRKSSNPKIDMSRNTTIIGSKRGIVGNGQFINDETQDTEESCTIQLTETDTIIQFALTSFIVPSDTRDVKEIDERNQKYENIILSHRNQVDNYTTHPTQTMNNPLKNQNEMVAPNASQDFECQVNSYDIKDNLNSMREMYNNINSPHSTTASVAVGSDTMDYDDGTGFILPVRKFIAETINMAIVTPGCLLDPSDLRHKPRNPGDIKPLTKAELTQARRVAAAATGAGVLKSRNAGATGATNVGVSHNSQDESQDVSSDGRSSGNTSRLTTEAIGGVTGGTYGGTERSTGSDGDFSPTAAGASSQHPPSHSQPQVRSQTMK